MLSWISARYSRDFFPQGVKACKRYNRTGAWYNLSGSPKKTQGIFDSAGSGAAPCRAATARHEWESHRQRAGDGYA